MPSPSSTGWHQNYPQFPNASRASVRKSRGRHWSCAGRLFNALLQEGVRILGSIKRIEAQKVTNDGASTCKSQTSRVIMFQALGGSTRGPHRGKEGEPRAMKHPRIKELEYFPPCGANAAPTFTAHKKQQERVNTFPFFASPRRFQPRHPRHGHLQGFLAIQSLPPPPP